MNDQMNAPMSPAPSGSAPFYQAWINALTKPSDQTFANMVSEPGASSTKAFIWVFVCSLVYFFFASLVQGAVFRQMMQQFGGGGSTFRNGFGGGFVGAICGAPIFAVIFTLMFAIGVAIYQMVAKMFGGRGNFNQMAYAAGAITAPIMLINIVFTLLGAIPLVGLCFGIVSILISLYAVVLHVMAIKGVNQFGWGQAIGSAFLPGIILCCCLSVGVIGIMRVLGPRVNDVFNQINNSLAP